MLVDVALAKLIALREGVYSNTPSLPLRVLDLGTGSGALLLSLLHQTQVLLISPPLSCSISYCRPILSPRLPLPPLTHCCQTHCCQILIPCSPQNSSRNKQEGAMRAGLGRVVGVGVDLDKSALSAANSNAARANLTEVCRWACHDFSQLGEVRVRRELMSTVSACEDFFQSNDPTASVKSEDTAVVQSNDHHMFSPRNGLFDVIICNPPYLSAPSVCTYMRECVPFLSTHPFEEIFSTQTIGHQYYFSY